MPLNRNEVGSLLYVWSANKGQPGNRKCVITAHGGKAFINGMGKAPATTLMYYGPHGRALKDPGLENILTRRAIAYEVTPAQQSQDYNLGKYTNTDEQSTQHNKNKDNPETYATIARLPDDFKREVKMMRGNLAVLMSIEERTHDQDSAIGSTMEVYNRHKDGVWLDIVTLRNRGWSMGPKLSEVLEILWKNYYRYDEVHCCFCRGGGEGFHGAVLVKAAVQQDAA